MIRIFGLSVVLAFTLSSSAAFAVDECAKITATGHPQYPVIAYKDRDRISGAAAMLVETIGKELKVPVESKYTGTWADAQAAARDGKADMIFGIYYNDERATYLDYVRPAFIFDPVVVFVAKDKTFPFTGQQDLVGKKGATNKGESYGTDFDAFIEKTLSVERTDGVDDAFAALLAGKVDYVIAGYYPGLAEAAEEGVKDKIEALNPALLTAEMFVAFSKKSPCKSLAPQFGEAIATITTDGRFDKMLKEAVTGWDAARKAKK